MLIEAVFINTIKPKLFTHKLFKGLSTQNVDP
jgi:hypothetical protein